MNDSDRPHFHEGVTLFNAGQWWEAHEAWEGLWMHAGGPDRAFYQALILLAAALHKRWHHGSLTHRNYHKAAKYLDELPAEYAGVNLRQVQADVWAALHDPARRAVITLNWGGSRPPGDAGRGEASGILTPPPSAPDVY